jgi:hypothetical protein
MQDQCLLVLPLPTCQRFALEIPYSFLGQVPFRESLLSAFLVCADRYEPGLCSDVFTGDFSADGVGVSEDSSLGRISVCTDPTVPGQMGSTPYA